MSPNSNTLFSRFSGKKHDPAEDGVSTPAADASTGSATAAESATAAGSATDAGSAHGAGSSTDGAVAAGADAPTITLDPLPAPVAGYYEAVHNEVDGRARARATPAVVVDPREVAHEVRNSLFGEVEPAELVADEITAWFGKRKVLDRVSLTMKKGEVTALIGPSGCGKSTFLRILNRMHEMVPSASLAGEVLLEGTNIYDRDQRITASRRNIGMIFQKPNPFPAMSIYENVVAGLKMSGIRASKDYKDVLVEDSLRKASLWDEVKDRLDQPGAGLSGGQQQRLCIARSLAVSPRVLLMDEPCSALDPTSTRRVEETIEQLKGSTTIVIVTHNMQQARRVSTDCAFFLAAQNTPGQIVEHGPTEAMFERPRDQRTNDYVNGRFG